MRRSLLSLVPIIVGICAASCSGELGEEGGDGQACYPNQTCNAELTCEDGTCAPGGTDTDTTDTSATSDAWVTDTNQAADADPPEPDQFGAPCDEDDDCFSGLCVGHMGDTVCSKTCEGECPAGWSCAAVLLGGSDPLYLCISSFEHLCKPCLSADECTSTSSQAACVGYGDEGDFCGAACTEDGDCPSGFLCQQSVSTRGGQSSQCVDADGVCECSGLAASLGLVTTCAASSDLGTCEGLRTCSADGLSACDATPPVEETCNGLDDDCDGETDEVDCDDGNPCTSDTCAGADGCAFEPVDGGECLDGDACTQGDHCAEGVCVGDPIVCDDSNSCTDDTCDPEGGCVHTPNFADCDDGDACTLGDTCKAGACAAGAALACDDQNPCTDDLCDEAVGCDHQPNASTCDDGNACTDGDACVEGLCLGVTAVICDDDNPCTHDACSPQGGCVNTPHALPCDDGSVCTLGDACEAGACLPGSVTLACDDGNPCTDDLCVGATGCQHTANIADCDDGNDCTTDDLCTDGACTGQGQLTCDDQNPCTTDSCLADGGCDHAPTDGACSDGDLCTVGDTCVEGTCTTGVAQGCDDGNPCTDDSCGDDGLCVHAPNVAACDDDNLCTQADTCAGGACVGTNPPDCHDGSVCTNDWCDPSLGCQSVPNTAPCDDGDACTTSDTCSGGTCDGLISVTCDDQNGCTDDTCDPAIGCLFAPNTAPCDDGNLCTQTDVCSGEVCVGSGPLACDDGEVCTNDWCDPGLGCQTAHNAAPCDDGDPCTVDDHCLGGTCVTTAGAINEICDGDDNDCDGEIDEDLAAIDCGLGDCAHSIPGCVDGEVQVCDPLEGATAEVCDGDDNDCDGEIDEDLATIDCGLGDCAHSIPGCVDGEVQVCDPLEGATAEVCDGDDNDCDGEIDEDLATIDCGLGDCAHSISGCVDGEVQVCDPLEGATAEVCDGDDNDCDGEADEDLATIDCGLGDCAHSIPGCVDSEVQVCDPLEGATAEVCDGDDNDCDGEADEDLATIDCGLGDCAHSSPGCVDGEVQVCDPLEGATAEVCDGADNDCDGVVDDGLGQTTCGQGVCTHTIDNCANGASVFCNPFQGATSEICDGLDNDCDGAKNEDGVCSVVGAGGEIHAYNAGGVAYKSHTFIYPGTFTVTLPPGRSYDVLVVGGGGSGQGSPMQLMGGGGGGGAVRVFTGQTAPSIAITIGAGGIGDTGNGQNGSTTSAGGLSAGYGAKGGSTDASGPNGGGGGGQAFWHPMGWCDSLGTGGSGGSYGYDGGDGACQDANGGNLAGGGGGGSGGPGGHGVVGSNSATGGAGGAGTLNSYRTGSPISYGGGGSGGTNSPAGDGSQSTAGAPGGGGGTGGDHAPGGDAPANRGGGGGGSGGSNWKGGNGGSGVVVIRYQSE